MRDFRRQAYSQCVSMLMTKILAIDSSTAACSVALSVDGEVEEQFVLAAQEHTRRLLPMVDDLLIRRGLELVELDAIAFAQGPGSFTGLRIGAGVVQGLAFGANLPVIPLSTLEVLAAGAQRILSLPKGSLIAPVLDARMGEVYGALYAKGREELELQPVLEDCVMEPAALARVFAKLSQGEELHLVGNGSALMAEACPRPEVKIHEDIHVHAFDVARLAEPRLRAGKTVTAMNTAPVYIRNEVSWAKRKRIRN